MRRKIYGFTRNTLAIASGLVVAACGGGGGSGASGSGQEGASAMVVTPSLGKFSVGTVVKLKRARDGFEISSATIDSTGSAALDLKDYGGPVIVEVIGSNTSTYFDEGTSQWEPFASGQKLRAVMPAPAPVVGVTSLTNAAVTKLETDGDIAQVTINAINDANTKVAKAFDLVDVLAAPTPVGSTSGAKLNIATVGDKYALVLAALASTATSGKKAVDVAAALAQDLKDDKLDGQNSSGGTSVPVPNSPTASAISAKYQDAANALADDTSKQSIAAKPLPVTADVSAVVSKETGTALAKAKSLFSDLRTAVQAFTNVGKTGFLDTQAQRASDDLEANVAPNLDRVLSRLSALGIAKKMYDDASLYSPGNTFGLIVGNTPPIDNAGTFVPQGSALTRQTGSWENIWYGYDSREFEYCWSGSTTGLGGRIFCAAGTSASVVNKTVDSITGVETGTARMISYELTKNGTTGVYNYTARRYDVALTVTNGYISAGTAVLRTTIPTGTGTFSSVSTSTGTQFMLSGTMPPSATNSLGNLVTTEDSLSLNGITTTVADGLASGLTRYTINGSVSTADKTDTAKTVQLSMDAGTYLDVDEANSTPSSKSIVVAKLMGSVATAKTRFSGAFEFRNWANYQNARTWHPTNIVLNGSVDDKSTNGAGEFLLGRLEANELDTANFNSTLDPSPTNYTRGNLTFSGTIKAPTRPVLNLVLSAVRTGFNTKTATLSYSYDNKTIVGSGTANDDAPASDTMTLSNQDGVQYVTKTGIVSKSGTTLARVANGNVYYIDGTSESLQ